MSKQRIAYQVSICHDVTSRGEFLNNLVLDLKSFLCKNCLADKIIFSSATIKSVILFIYYFRTVIHPVDAVNISEVGV